MKLCPSNCWNFKKPIRHAAYEAIKTAVVYLISDLEGFKMENTNFGNPVFNKAEKWNLMAYFPKSGITLKTWNIQLILAKIYLETSKTRPSIFLLKVILNIFHPSPKTPNFLWHRTEACKSFLFKSMLSNLYGEYSTWRIKGSADTQT